MNDEIKRILIMEDSDIFADMLMDILKSDNLLLERAVNGFEGIKKVYSFLPHLIITDVEMPLFMGHQVTRFLKSRKSTAAIPVIMFTTLTETKDKFWGILAGADMYIEKAPNNFKPLKDAVSMMVSLPRNIDFAAIERESKKINDNSIIEIVNSLLDKKLFQTTVINKLMDLSDNVFSLEMITKGIMDLLQTISEVEIAAITIRGAKGAQYIHTANFAGLLAETADDFINICTACFNRHFPDFKLSSTATEEFLLAGNNEKKISSYITIPLAIGGESFALVHIANSINDYFTPSIMEDINVFLESASLIVSNVLSMRELEELQKNTRAAFARYVPANVMDEIIETSSKMAKQSESRNVTVLFSDIRDFTTLAEHSKAQEVVDFLNSYFTRMGSEIILENGNVDKFIGDAIMAVFGAFGDIENSSKNAMRTAVKMLAALEEMNALGAGLFRNNINIGIGINYGECILGNIGFQNKMDYTVIGDTVNLASRIEGLTKFYRRPIIVSEYVYEAAKDSFLFRKIDKVRVIGKKKPVDIYALYTGFTDSENKIPGLPIVSALLLNRETFDNYNKGLQVFYLREWKLAGEYFTKAAEANKNDFLSQLYLQRAIEYTHTPPPDDWDGVA